VFEQLSAKVRPRKSLILSLALHCALIYLIFSSRARFVQPSSVAFGNSGIGTSTQIIYLGSSSVPRQIMLRSPAPKLKSKRKIEVNPKAVEQPSADAPIESARAGSMFGSSSTGPSSGYESRPALPVVFPNPAVEKSDIPSGVAGDVVVEVTIDEKGNVADTKVLQSVGYGLEDKVLQALKNWRFTPATMNGIAIASRQDVHFHFPS
jgi:TonB family protein